MATKDAKPVVEARPLLASSPTMTADMEKQGQRAETGQPALEISTRSKIMNAQFILLNTSSTVAIVFMNKIIFTDPQLTHCQITIAIWHFLCTFLVLYLATLRPISLFPAIRLSLAQTVPISIFFASFLLLGNLSLSLNTTTFYQLAKVLTTPTICLLNYLLFNLTVSKETLLSIAAVCVGVTLVNAQLALSNIAGTLVAAVAFTVTALYQIWIGKKLGELKISAPQLLLNQAPVSVLLLACIAPFVDTSPDFSVIPRGILWTLVGSGLLASLLNLSQFLIIGRTSALTFNIVSNLKTVMIVGFSWCLEGKVPGGRDVVGVGMALGGAWAYSRVSRTR